MKSFINWVSLSSSRVIMMIQFSFLLLPLLQVSFIIVESFNKDLKQTINTACISFIVNILLVYITGSNSLILLSLVFSNLFIGAFVGKLFRHKFNLSHAYQALNIFLVILICPAAFLLFPSPVGLIDSVFQNISPLLIDSGLSADQIVVTQMTLSNLFYGILLWVLFIQSFLGILIGHYWCSALQKPVSLNYAFARLALGRRLGLAFVFIIVASQLTVLLVLSNMALIAWTSMFICGLSVAHYRLSLLSLGWPPFIILYLALLMPLSMNYVALMLVIIGIIDVFTNLRK
jgi:hypothetical protein